MRFKTIATALATVVLATVLAPIAVSAPAVAQSQTDWYVNDNPSLFGPSEYWFWCNSGHGYGSNNCRYTYAIGGESTAGNWAQWNMGSRVGRQEIQVYIPSDHATATVNYNITIGNNTHKRAVAQLGTSGWHSLGNWNTNGANVMIAVYDNDASQHWERDGYVSSSIGVDAIAMRCNLSCGPTPPPPPPPPGPDPEVTISLGANNSGSNYCPYSQLPCRWVNITMRNFSRGSYLTRCVWLHSESGSERVPIRRNISHNGAASATLNGVCSFNVREGRSVWVTIDGVRSNILRFSGDPPPPTTTTQPEQSGIPSVPRNLRLSLTDDNGFRATWDQPSSSGGSRITKYVIRVSRPRLSASVAPFSRTYERTSRSFTFNGRNGATYTVQVVAENLHGPSAARSASITVGGGSQTPPAPAGPGEPRDLIVDSGPGRVVVSWEAPSSQVDKYSVTYSRPRLHDDIAPWERSYSVDSPNTSHTIRLNRANVTYRVEVIAHNQSRQSEPLIGEFITIGRYAHQPVITIPWNSAAVTDEVPNQTSGTWNKKGHGGGTGRACGTFGGCDPEDGFWHTNVAGRDSYRDSPHAYWEDFGRTPFRGEYSVEVFVPESGAKYEDGSNIGFRATGNAKYTIEEKRAGSSTWRPVGYFIIDQGQHKGKLDTFSLARGFQRNGFESHVHDQRLLREQFNTGTWELDGQVRIKIQGKGGSIAADSISLVPRDLLYIDERLATTRCRNNVLDVLKKRAWIGLGLDIVVSIGQGAALSLITAGIGSAILVGGLALKITDTLVLVGKIAEWVAQLNNLLKTFNTISTFYSNIKLTWALWNTLSDQISGQLSGDTREAFDLYFRRCSRPDGVTFADVGGLTGIIRQAFLRSGYLDYLDPDSVS